MTETGWLQDQYLALITQATLDKLEYREDRRHKELYRAVQQRVIEEARAAGVSENDSVSAEQAAVRLHDLARLAKEALDKNPGLDEYQLNYLPRVHREAQLAYAYHATQTQIADARRRGRLAHLYGRAYLAREQREADLRPQKELRD
jgi:hypothetical protein